MSDRYDVVIVGGAVAGCILALSYARKDLKVAVLEQKDNHAGYKVLCTHFVQPIALPVFQKLDLVGPLEAVGALRTKAAFWTDAGWIDPPEDYGADASTAHAYNIERRLLDPFLRSQLASHPEIDLRMGHRVTEVGREDSGWLVKTDGESGPAEFHARLVVATDGRHSPVAAMLGNKGETEENHRSALFGYFEGIPAPPNNRSIFILSEPDRGFLYPLCEGRTLLALYVPKSYALEWQSSGAALEQKIYDYFHRFPGMPDFSNARLASRIFGYADYPNLVRQPVFDGVAFAGDAALSLDPLSGVGCGFAAKSADMLAEATWSALRGGTDLNEPLASYESEFNKLFLPHARGIKADSLIAKSPEMAVQTYRCITSSTRLQKDFVDLTGRIISPARFQAAYASAMVRARIQAQRPS